jgi:hypothetical protein
MARSRPTPLLLVLGLLLAGVAGCKQEAPSPWKEMNLPLRNGELMPGASSNALRVIYRGTGKPSDLIREFKRGLERTGYEFERDGKAHDPAGSAFSAVYKKGSDLVQLTITGDPDVTVELKRLD